MEATSLNQPAATWCAIRMVSLSRHLGAFGPDPLSDRAVALLLLGDLGEVVGGQIEFLYPEGVVHNTRWTGLSVKLDRLTMPVASGG